MLSGNIFSNQPIENIKEPVKWLKNKPQLLFLFNTLIERNLVVSPESLYKTLIGCFRDRNYKQFKLFAQSNQSAQEANNRDIKPLIDLINSL